MNYIVDVENWTRLEEELVELEMFRANEEIRMSAIETANDMSNGEHETFEVVSSPVKEDVRYKFAFSVQTDEDTEERTLYYHGWFKV